MNGDDLIALAPLLVLAAGAIVVMLQAGFWRRHGWAASLTVLALIASLLVLPWAASVAPRRVTALLMIDGFALFYLGLLCAAALAVTLLTYGYLYARGGLREELYVLILTATLGAAVLVASTHFASFFLGLELLSVSLFALVAYPVSRRQPLEAAVKYLVLSGLSSALLLFGIALIYFKIGVLDFAGVAAPANLIRAPALLLAGFALLLAGLGFKLSLVPFHLWAPDVYEGAPAPIAGFLATVSKGAVAALLLRYLSEAQVHAQPSLVAGLEAVALVSILVGNLLALLQDNLKRILAYSSIAHFGYLLVAFVVGGPFGHEAAAYYLAAYMVMTLGAFGVIARLSAPDAEHDLGQLEDYRGLFWRQPWLGAVLTAMLLSLAGIPLTVGFVAKFYVFAIGVDGARWALVAALVIGSVIGLFYYLRVISALFAQPPASIPMAALSAGSSAAASDVVLVVLTLLLVWFGVYPEPAMQLIRLTATLP
ncbi:MAG TPA: NADH-quinone oxidoreductase subunit N [Burkholderiales bacterium]|nr:NADH-quinone oxidoreductase subunit N [Burkholderiales bacterium]